MKTKRIQVKDLKPGMKIKSYNPETKSIVFNEVTHKWNSQVEIDRQRTLVFTNGSTLDCSFNHPIMVYEDGNVREVFPDDLTSDHNIITESGFCKLHGISGSRNNETYIDITVDKTHTFFVSNSKDDDMILTHNSQGGVRGGAATLYYPLWHYEVEDLLVLKNNKGTEDNRIRHLDYGVQFNKVMYERLLSGGNITLFSPKDVPEMYDAFFTDVDKFRDLYEKAEKNTKLRKKVIPAIELFSMFMQERKDTGRIYLMNVDHANDHGSFIKDKAAIRMSNLCCLSGDTEITVEHSDGSIEDVKIKDAKTGDKVYSRNVMTGKNEFREIKASLMTRENAQVMRITDTETGNSIVCTPDHKVYTKNRGYVEAKDLVESDQLLIE
jgi:intein/homing endonuclease